MSVTREDNDNTERARIPPEALAGMESWEARLAWAFDQARLTWRLRAPHGEIRYLKVYAQGQEPCLAAERDRLAWAAERLPVPTVLSYGSNARHEWLVTSGLAGVDATDDGLRADPPRLVPLLAAGLRRFHAVPVDGCPFDKRAAVLLRAARQRMANGLVDAAHDFHPEHHGLTLAAVRARLQKWRPAREDLVVCHGDYCLPNVLIAQGGVTGFVDLGNLGVADRWYDLAIATWSITWNLGPGWESLFLETYGVEWDRRKQAFYRLLYDLLP